MCSTLGRRLADVLAVAHRRDPAPRACEIALEQHGTVPGAVERESMAVDDLGHALHHERIEVAVERAHRLLDHRVAQVHADVDRSRPLHGAGAVVEDDAEPLGVGVAGDAHGLRHSSHPLQVHMRE